MPSPIGPLGPTTGPGRVRRRRAAGGEAAAQPERAEAASAPEAISPLPAASARPEDALSAHLMGQASPAEGAEIPANTARRAHSTYLGVEWSGPRDRRTRRGRIAKTEI